MFCKSGFIFIFFFIFGHKRDHNRRNVCARMWTRISMEISSCLCPFTITIEVFLDSHLHVTVALVVCCLQLNTESALSEPVK